MSYRDTATALAQRTPGNFIGVVLYVPMGGQSMAPWWSVAAFSSSGALEEWYDETAGSPTLYYYLAAFDKQRGAAPVGEAIAPPKHGAPGFDIHSEWRHPPFKRPAISGEVPRSGRTDYARGFAIFAALAIPFGIAFAAKSLGRG